MVVAVMQQVIMAATMVAEDHDLTTEVLAEILPVDLPAVEAQVEPEETLMEPTVTLMDQLVILIQEILEELVQHLTHHQPQVLMTSLV
jgi:hypothetical protein